MKIIKDPKLLNQYIKKHNLGDWFSQIDLTDMQIFHYNRGEYIARSGEPLEYFMFFVKGRCKVYTIMQNGKSYLLKFYEPLQVIGDLELMYDVNTGCNCHVETLAECECIAIPMTTMIEKYFNDTTFLKAVSYSLSEKINSAAISNSVNLLYTLESRLASYILALAMNNTEFHLNETYSDMADLLGTSYRHLARTLNKFVEEGLIEKQKHSILILNVEGLESYAGDLMI